MYSYHVHLIDCGLIKMPLMQVKYFAIALGMGCGVKMMLPIIAKELERSFRLHNCWSEYAPEVADKMLLKSIDDIKSAKNKINDMQLKYNQNINDLHKEFEKNETIYGNPISEVGIQYKQFLKDEHEKINKTE